jgi:arylsulfatase A-like enzyme
VLDRLEFVHGLPADALEPQIDLYPTRCDLLDVEVPAWVEGESLLPLVRGETDAVRDAVFSEVTYHAAYEPKRCVRTARYKYVRRFGDYEGRVGPNTDDGPSKQFLVERGFFDEELPREELYDLHRDPNERVNLVGDAAHREVHEDLRERLTDWMARTDDPLLDGPVPKPAGAVVDVQDALHPGTSETDPPDLR